MIGRLLETGDRESAGQRLSIVKVPKNNIQPSISSNVQNKDVSTDLDETKMLSRPSLTVVTEHNSIYSKPVEYSAAINLLHSNPQNVVLVETNLSEPLAESGKSVCAVIGASKTIDVMSVQSVDDSNVCTSTAFDKTLKNSVRNCQQQNSIISDTLITNECKDFKIQSPYCRSDCTETLKYVTAEVYKVSCTVVENINDEQKVVRKDYLSHGSHPNSMAISISNTESIERTTDSATALSPEQYNVQMTKSVDFNKSNVQQHESTSPGIFSSASISQLTTEAVDGIQGRFFEDSTRYNDKLNTSLTIKTNSNKSNYINSCAQSTTVPILNVEHATTQLNTLEIMPSNTVLNTTTSNASAVNLNSHYGFNKLQNNSQLYKVQNVLVKTSSPNANGFVTKIIPSIHPATSQSYKVSCINTSNTRLRGSSSASANTYKAISKINPSKTMSQVPQQIKETLKSRRNRKASQMSFNTQITSKKKDIAMDHIDQQKHTGYSTKLPNIISKIRDNLSSNSVMKTKTNRKMFSNTTEKNQQMSVVRVHHKYVANNVSYMQQRAKSKQNKSADQVAHLNLLNRRPLAVSVNELEQGSENVFSESIAVNHSSVQLQQSPDLTDIQIAPRTGPKQSLKTGQNNNIDVLPSSPSLWKQMTGPNLGNTIISENVTPITTSNTWDDVTRFCNKPNNVEIPERVEVSKHKSPCPEILIVRGDPQAVSQRAGCDEEFIGEEIRPEPTDHLPAAYHSLQIVLQDHNYGAPPPSTPMMSPSADSFPRHEDEDVASVVSIESNNQRDNEEDEETETAPEEDNDSPDMMDDKNSVTRCICDFQHDDGYMIQCGQCLVWQHIVCVGVTPKRIPKKYLCDFCQPRDLDRYRAHALQKMIRDDLNMLTSSDSSPTRTGDRDRAFLKSIISKKRSESSIHFPLSYNTTRNKRIRRDPSPKVKVRRPYKERKKVLRRKVKTDMDRPFVRPWLENYELAATNHYSQELRARLSGITKKQDERPNFVLADSTTIPFAGGRIMISTIEILPSTPVIELMGKFMLSSQHQNATALLLGTNSRQVTQKPGPFVFFYRMPQEGTDVCIDTRTYGNEARFVRRSCKPNCELHHWFDKGTLHIYLMSIDKIESNTEITLRHEFGWHGLGIGRTPSNPCACNSPECLLLNPVQNRRNYAIDNLPKTSLRLGKTRSMVSRSYLKSKSASPKSDITIPEEELEKELAVPPAADDSETHSEFVVSPVKSSQESDNTSDDLRKIMAYCSDTKNVPESPKSLTSLVEEPIVKPAATFTKRNVPVPTRRTRIYTRRNRINKKLPLELSALQDSKRAHDSGEESYMNVKDIKKMTREERKIAQVMKVFDRLEKDRARRTTGVPRNRRQDSESDYARRDESTDMEHTSPEVRVYKSRGKGRRKQFTRTYNLKSKRTISEGASDDQPSIKKQLTRKPNSVDGRRKLTSQSDADPLPESVSTPKVDDVQASTSFKRGLRKRKTILPKKQPVATEPQQGQQTEEAAGLLLALARSTPATCDGPANEVAESPISNMISVCQLVEAAVGPLETSLKSPKKAILNEWMNKSPEQSVAFEIPEPAPAFAESSTSPLTLFCLGNESVQNRNMPSSKLLDTLVQAASSICDIGSTYPEKAEKHMSQMNDVSISKAPFNEHINNEVDIEHKNSEQTSVQSTVRTSDDEANIKQNSLSPDKSLKNILESESSFKDNVRTVVQMSSNKIHDEKLTSSLNENLNVMNLDSKHEGNFGGVSDSLDQVESTDVDSENRLAHPDIFDNNIATNLSDNSCNTEPFVKNSTLDITTDLSNDSNNVGLSYQANSSGSAKKRWLHQALSEESDIPVAIEVSTPLKKRRVVRESTSDVVPISCDDITESTTDAKNFQSATTVTSIDSNEKDPLENKKAVVADNKEQYATVPTLVLFEDELKLNKNAVLATSSSIKNGISENEIAFDWENLEHQDNTIVKLPEINPVAVDDIDVETESTHSSPKLNNTNEERRSPRKHPFSDEIADIHKRLQSFHSENIQVLRSRNQKPKITEGQRKKVNLMFEVSILEDETVAVELCNESKVQEVADVSNIIITKSLTPPNEIVESMPSTQVISFDFDEFARNESDTSHSLEPDINMEKNSEQPNNTPNHEPIILPSFGIQSVLDLSSNEHQDNKLNITDNCFNSIKLISEKPSSVLSFGKDLPAKLESSSQIPLNSPTNSLNKHEIGVAARARLDSILNATDISQDAMFDQVLKKSSVTHITNHLLNSARKESPSTSPIANNQTGHSKPIARTSSSDPRLQQSTPIKKKLSLTEYRARKKTDGNVNNSDVFTSNDKSFTQLNMLVSDTEEEPNEQENFMFTPEPTLVERELEKHPAFLLRDFFTVPSSIINDAAVESESEGSSSDTC